MSAEIDSACAYSLPHYRHILRKAKARYWLPLVREVAGKPTDKSFCLIRHDVDISAWAALEMAEVEKTEDVATTYYFRLHSTTYNLMTPDHIEVVKAIAGMGHEVGLHYEPGYFLELGEDPVAGTRRDIGLFEELLGQRTHSISQHQPAEGPVLDKISDDHPCAYDRDLVHDIPYFGDSGFHWREGCVCGKFDLHQLHTLIHPHSWVIWDREWQEVLRAHAGDLSARLTGEMEEYITSVEVYLANRKQIDQARVERYTDQ